MNDWKEYNFSAFVEINPKVSLKKGDLYSFVEMKDVNDGQRYCYPSNERVLSGGSRFINGDTLFARITPCLENGKISQVKNLKDGKGFGSTEFLIFRGKENISDNDFVFYLARWAEVRSFAEMNFDGTSGRQRVPKEAFNNLYLILPPLLEQKAIAQVLSSLDDKIELLQKQNETLERMGITLFNKIFFENGNNWEEKSLDQIANYLNGLALQKYPPESADFLPVIKIKELRNGVTEASDIASPNIPKEYIIEDGDVLFSWSGSLEIVIWGKGKGALNQHLFKVTSEKYPKWFYYFATKHHLTEFRRIAFDKATTMGHIQRHHLAQAFIPIPPKEEFENLDKKFTPIVEKIILNNAEINKVTKLRDTLLPKLMSGEVRVKCYE